MEYKIIKKNKLDSNLNETSYYQIKKKIFFNIWYYPIVKQNGEGLASSILAVSIILTPILLFSEYKIMSISLWFIINLLIISFCYFINGYRFTNLVEAEDLIKEKIKKKKFIQKEETISLITYKEGDLTIQK